MRLAISAALALVSGFALADDSLPDAARNQALRLEANDAVRLVALDIVVSLMTISSASTFRNGTDQAVTLRVTLPLPTMSPNTWLEYAIPDDAVGYNYFNVGLAVGEHAVEVEFNERAMLNGEDRSADLLALGIRLHPTAAQREALSRMPRSEIDALAALGLVEPGVDLPATDYRCLSSAGSCRDLDIPLWTYESEYTWLQVFPPLVDVVIQHNQDASRFSLRYEDINSFRDLALVGHYCISPQTKQDILDSFGWVLPRQYHRVNVKAFGYSFGSSAFSLETFRMAVSNYDQVSFCGQSLDSKLVENMDLIEIHNGIIPDQIDFLVVGGVYVDHYWASHFWAWLNFEKAMQP